MHGMQIHSLITYISLAGLLPRSLSLSLHHSVLYFISHTFPLPRCPPPLLPFSASVFLSRAQANRKCQVRPGYFRPNWEIDVPAETWHRDMPFILPHALPPKRQEPDMLTAHWKTERCPFFGELFSSDIQRQKRHWRSDEEHQSEKETTSGRKVFQRGECSSEPSSSLTIP